MSCIENQKNKILEQLKDALYREEKDPFEIALYNTLTFEQKLQNWKKRIWQNLQTTKSNEVHLHQMFQKNNYLLWKAKYEDIDIILDEVLEFLAYSYSDNELIQLLNESLGRSSRL
jgi:hypothetical protein